MKQQDERAFTPAFLASCTGLELAMLQHDLRKFPEDNPYLDQVLKELQRRVMAANMDVRGLRTEFDQLQRENADLRAHLAQLQQEKETAQRVRDALQEERDNWTADIRAQIAHHASIRERAEAAEAALVQCQQERETLKLEAQIHAGEARAQRATVHEIYQLCTGATGEPGDWHGAEPVERLVANLKASEQDRARLRAALQELIREGWVVADADMTALVGEPPPPEPQKENTE